MDRNKIIGGISYVVGILIILSFLVSWGIVGVKSRDAVSDYFGSIRGSAEEKIEAATCVASKGVYGGSGICYKTKTPEPVSAVCEEWAKTMYERKEKIAQSSEYLNKVINGELRLVLNLWEGFIARDDKSFYDKHVVPDWIAESEFVSQGVESDGVPYQVFYIKYSVKMGEWYYHKVAGYNMVIIRKDQRDLLIAALKNKKITVDQLRPASDKERFEMKSKFFYLDVADGAPLLAALPGFDGLVAAQKYPFTGDNLTCAKVVAALRQCDPNIKFNGLEYGLLTYGIDQVMQGIPKQHYSQTNNVWFSGASDLTTGRLSDCHEAVLDATNGQLSCQPVECVQTGWYEPF